MNQQQMNHHQQMDRHHHCSRNSLRLCTLCALLLSLSLTGCGKQGSPVYPPDTTYPRHYHVE